MTVPVRMAVAVFSMLAASPIAHAETDLVRSFDLVALGREFAQPENPRILKWTRPINVYVGRYWKVDDDDIAFLERHIATLSRETGIAAEFVDHPERSNFRVLFVAERDFLPTSERYFGARGGLIEKVASRANCLSVYFEDRDGAFDNVTVIIPVDKAEAHGLLRRCILEETTQSMGLVNDSTEIGRSLFNNRGGQVEEFNDHDRTLLRMLYHPRMRAGLGRSEALRIAREILPEVR